MITHEKRLFLRWRLLAEESSNLYCVFVLFCINFIFTLVKHKIDASFFVNAAFSIQPVGKFLVEICFILILCYYQLNWHEIILLQMTIFIMKFNFQFVEYYITIIVIPDVIKSPLTYCTNLLQPILSRIRLKSGLFIKRRVYQNIRNYFQLPASSDMLVARLSNICTSILLDILVHKVHCHLSTFGDLLGCCQCSALSFCESCN